MANQQTIYEPKGKIIVMKWEMIKWNLFAMNYNGYHVDLVLGGFYPRWTIVRDGIIIDRAEYHSGVTSDFNKELAAKAQIEKILNQLP